MQSKLLVVRALVCSVLVISACKGSSDPGKRIAADSSTKATACSLLRADLASQVLGGEVEVDSSKDGFKQQGGKEALSICTYTLKGEGAFDTVSLFVRLGSGDEPDADRLAQYQDSLRKNLGGDIAFEQIGLERGPGIWNESLGQLTFYLDHDMYILTILAPSMSDKKSKAVALVDALFGRLEK